MFMKTSSKEKAAFPKKKKEIRLNLLEGGMSQRINKNSVFAHLAMSHANAKCQAGLRFFIDLKIIFYIWNTNFEFTTSCLPELVLFQRDERKSIDSNVNKY